MKIETKRAGCARWAILVDGVKVDGIWSTDEVDARIRELEFSLNLTQNAARYTALLMPLDVC